MAKGSFRGSRRRDPLVYEKEGELSAAIEVRRLFPGITDNVQAWKCARSIAGWTPLSVQPRPVTRLRPRKDR
jgi:hypothetical protein